MNKFLPRTRFVVDKKIQWFPGHMRQGMRDVSKTLRSIDCILEIHDARIPFSGRNLNFLSKMSRVKPIILLLNKADLIDQRSKPHIVNSINDKMHETHVKMNGIFFMDSLTPKYVSGGYNSKLIDAIRNSVEKNINASDNRSLFANDDALNLMVVGIPNVGKSTIINRFRNIFLHKRGKATVTGPTAGVTKSVLEKIKIADSPRKMYLIDTPGILEPSFHRLSSYEDLEALMRCAVCGNVNDNVVGPELIVDYMLYWWNIREKHTEYMEYFGMPHPTNSVTELLTYGALKNNFAIKVRSLETGQPKELPDFARMSRKFLTDFRRGKLGPILLDDGFIHTFQYEYGL